MENNSKETQDKLPYTGMQIVQRVCKPASSSGVLETVLKKAIYSQHHSDQKWVGVSSFGAAAGNQGRNFDHK